MMNNKFVDVVRPGLLSNTFGEDSIIWVKLQQLFFFFVTVNHQTLRHCKGHVLCRKVIIFGPRNDQRLVTHFQLDLDLVWYIKI